jgi:hypothetical protein
MRTLFSIILLWSGPILSAQSDSTSNLRQFLFPEFSPGIVRLKSGESFTSLMNFNTVTGNMTFNQSGNLSDLNKPEIVDTISIQKRTFVFHEKVFLEVLVNAPVSLFIQHRSELTSTGRPGAYGITSQSVGPTSSLSRYLGDDNKTYNLKLPEDYKVTPSNYFYIRKDSILNRINSERQFLKLFPTREADIKAYINETKINIKRQEDLIRLVKYCNQILK